MGGDTDVTRDAFPRALSCNVSSALLATPRSDVTTADRSASGRRLVHVLRSLTARTCLGLASCFSLRALQAASGRLAPLVALVSARARDAVRTNLALCFPDMDEGARRQLARRSLVQGIATALELGPLWRWKPERVLSLVREVDGLERLEAACASGRGVVILGPHLGAWEVVSLFVSARRALTSLYRAPRVRGLDRMLRRARERFGARLVPAGPAGVRALYRALRGGEPIGLLPDQDPGRGGGIYAPFFGVPAHTSTLAARLLASTGSVPLLAWAERLERGRGYRLHFDALDAHALACGDVERATHALNLALERVIRSRPEQYLWSYRRFRHPPAGQRSPYRRGAVPPPAVARPEPPARSTHIGMR